MVALTADRPHIIVPLEVGIVNTQIRNAAVIQSSDKSYIIRRTIYIKAPDVVFVAVKGALKSAEGRPGHMLPCVQISAGVPQILIDHKIRHQDRIGGHVLGSAVLQSAIDQPCKPVQLPHRGDLIGTCIGTIPYLGLGWRSIRRIGLGCQPKVHPRKCAAGKIQQRG